MNLSIYDARVLSFQARVVAPTSVVRDLAMLVAASPAWTTPHPAQASTVFRVHTDTPGPGWQQVVRDGAATWSGDDPAQVPPYLAWAISDAALQHLRTSYLLFHGGAAAYRDRGLILPASSQSGKTTLVAGLLSAGFQYYSDDVVVLEPDTLELVPFAKCLNIKGGARGALASLYPRLEEAPHLGVGGESIWYLPPPETALPGGPVPVRYVVVPSYAPGVETALTPIARSEALQCLVQQSFNLGAQGTQGMEQVVQLLRGAACFALSVGDLERAVRLLRELIESGV